MSEGKRYPLNMRTTKAVRDRLANAAEASGRSLAQEVEHRVEQSFLMDDAIRTIRETIRAEMQAEREAKQPPADWPAAYLAPHGVVLAKPGELPHALERRALAEAAASYGNKPVEIS